MHFLKGKLSSISNKMNGEFFHISTSGSFPKSIWNKKNYVPTLWNYEGYDMCQWFICLQQQFNFIWISKLEMCFSWIPLPNFKILVHVWNWMIIDRMEPSTESDKTNAKPKTPPTKRKTRASKLRFVSDCWLLWQFVLTSHNLLLFF